MYIWWICFRLTKIEHLDAVPHLQMLYLQKNKINKIENLSHLKQLKKLYLSCNKISVIENLEDLTKLEGKYHPGRYHLGASWVLPGCFLGASFRDIINVS